MDVLNENLRGSFPRFAQYAATLAQNHSHLDVIADVKLEVNPNLTTEFGDPCSDFDTGLMRNLLKVLLHESLPESFFSPLDGRFVADHALVIGPSTLQGLLHEVLTKRLHAEA